MRRRALAEHKAERGMRVKHLFLEGRALITSLLWIAFITSLMGHHFLTSWLPTAGAPTLTKDPEGA
jgi:hypothetical protein